MDPGPATARAIAAGRVLIGAGLLAAPGTVAARWLGADAQRGATQSALRGLGARDLALGAGVLASLGDGRARPWVAAGVLADGADLAAAALAGDAIPSGGRAITVALAGGATVAGVWLLTALR